MKNLNLSSPVFIVIMLIVASCGGEEAAEDTGPKYNFEKADSLPSGYLEELGIVKTNIEVTARLFAHMNEEGYSFNESILLPAGKNFSGSAKQAMGIGAIGSDLVFTSSFGQNQVAISRLDGLMGIAGSLGISEAFDQKLLSQMTSDDSTINKSVLLTKAYLKAKDQLFSDERAQLATFMIIGGWLEGMHIGCQMLKKDIKNDDIKIGFWELCSSYESIIHLTKVFKNNQDMVNIGEQIHGISSAIGPVKKHAKKYHPKDVEKLGEAIDKLRNSSF